MQTPVTVSERNLETAPWRPTRTVAVILAGGTGERVGLGIPKQLIKIAGKAIIEHTIAVFEAAPEIDEIIVLMTPGHLEEAEQIVARAGFAKVTQVIEGGATRNDDHPAGPGRDRRRGAPTCSSTTRCARWSASASSRECVDALWRHEAVDVAIPSADTIVDRRRRGLHHRHPAARAAAPGPDAAGVPIRHDPRGLRAGRGGPATSAPPTTARVVLRYLPDVPIGVVDGDEREHEGHRADRRLPRRQALPARPAATGAPATVRRRLPRGARPARPWWSSAAATASAPTSPSSPGASAPTCSPFSRSSTSTHVERRADDRRGRPRRCLEADRPGRLRRQHRRRAAARHARRDQRGDDLRRRPRSTTSRRSSSPRLFYPTSRATQGPLLLFTSSSYTRGRSRLQPLLLGQGRHGQPHPGARRRVGRARRCGSTASTPSAPAPRCAPRPSATSRRDSLLWSPRRSPRPRSTCCSPT